MSSYKVKVRGVLYPVDITKECPLGVRPQHYQKTRMCAQCDHNQRTNYNCYWAFDKMTKDSEEAYYANLYRVDWENPVFHCVVVDENGNPVGA